MKNRSARPRSPIYDTRIKTCLLLIILVSSACVGDGQDLTSNGRPLTQSFANNIQPIFDNSCVSCHQEGGIGFTETGGDEGGLDLSSGNSYRSLVNMLSFQAPERSPKWRVRPGEPDESYLLQKLISVTPKQGQRMPIFGIALSDDEIDQIRTWIAEDAFEN